jgi:hypothetical protein
MNKPRSLHTALTAALDPRHNLSARPADFHMKIVNLTPQASGRPGNGFVYKYTLALGLLDFAGNTSEIVVPLMRWIERWQHDLLLKPDAFSMEVDFLADDMVDVLVRLDLTEVVRFVPRPVEPGEPGQPGQPGGPSGAVDLVFVEEPLPFALQEGAPLHAVYLDDNLLVHCQAHPGAGL